MKDEILELNKENALTEWSSEIKKSWTWARLTEQERERFENCIFCEAFKKALRGKYLQRWEMMNRVYSVFLAGVGCDSIDWRANNND